MWKVTDLTSVDVLEQMGEETDGVIESTSKLQEKIKALSGVNILTESGDYKDTYTILKEIGQVWEDMSDIDQSALLELMAGKNRANTLAAILGNMKDLEGAYNTALNSDGSALKENAAYMDSIQGKIDQFNNAMQTMWMNLIDDEVVKWIVDLGTSIVQLIDKFGALRTMVGAIVTVKSIGFGDLKKELDSINKDSPKLLNIFGRKQNTGDEGNPIEDFTENAERAQEAIENMMSAGGDEENPLGDFVENAENAEEAIGRLTQTEEANTVATEINEQATINNAGARTQDANATNGETTSQNVNTQSHTRNTAATWLNVAATKALVVAKNLLKGLAFGVVAGAATALFSWVISKFKSVEEKAKELKEQVDDLTESYKDAKQEFSDNLEILVTTDTEGYDDLLSEFEALSEGVNSLGENVSLTTDEYNRYKEICEAIVGVNPSLAEGYDNATQAISANKGALAQLIELQKEEARLAAAEYVSYGAYSNNGNFKLIADSAISEFEAAQDQLEDFTNSSADTSLANVLYDVFNWDIVGTSDYGNQGDKKDDFANYIMQIIGFTPEEIDEILASYYEDGVNFNYYDWIYDYASQIAAHQNDINTFFSNIITDPSNMIIGPSNRIDQEQYAREVLKSIGIEDGFFSWQKDASKIIGQYMNEYSQFQFDLFRADYADEIDTYNQEFFQGSIDAFDEWVDGFQTLSNDISDARDGMIDAYLQVPNAIKGYSELSGGTQSFITEWIKNNEMFKIDENTTQKDILATKQVIESMVKQIINGKYTVSTDEGTFTAQSIIDQIFALNPSDYNFGQYKEKMQELIDLLWEAIGGEDNDFGFADKNTLAIQLGFELIIGDENEEFQAFKTRVAEITGESVETVQDWLDSLPPATVKRLIAFDWTAEQAGSLTFQEILDKVTPVVGSTAPIVQTFSGLSESINSMNEALETSKELFTDGVKTTEDYYDSLIELGISESDLGECIDKSNGYIVTNADKLKELLKLKEDEIKFNIKIAKSLVGLQYSDVIQSISDQIMSTTVLENVNQELVDSLFDQASALRSIINQYQLLENSLLGATNAFTQFSKAQEIDSQNTYGSTFVEMAQTMYDAIYKTGQVGTEAFWAAVKATVPDDVYMGLAPGEQQIQAISRYLQDNVFSGFTIDGDSFTIDYKSVESFVRDAQSKGLFTGTDTSAFGLSPEFTSSLQEGENGLKKFAEQMGVTEEYVYAMLSEIDKYNTNGIGLSMLFQLDSSTTSQYIILNAQLEQALATRKMLLEQGADLSANTAQISHLQSQQAGVRSLATANTARYLTVANALEDPTKTVGEVLSEELIIEIGLQGKEGQPIESVFQEVSDWLLQLEEPTILDLEISQESVHDSIQELESTFGKENLETELKIRNGDIDGTRNDAISDAILDRYSGLLNLDQYIDDALSANLTTTETLLTQIAKNTGIMAGTEEAPSKEEGTNDNSSNTTTDNDGMTDSPQSERPAPDTLVADTINDIIQFRTQITNEQMDLSKSGVMNAQQQYAYDSLAYIASQAKEIEDMLIDGAISGEEALRRFQQLQENARPFGITTIDTSGQPLSTDISNTQEALEGTTDAAQEAQNGLERLFSVTVPDSEAIKMLQAIEDKTQELSSEDAIILGLSVDDGAVWTVQDALDVLIARNQQYIAGLHDVKQISIDTYSELQNQVASYNDIASQSNEIVSKNTEVTQEYHDTLIAMADSKEDVIACFGDETSLIVKDTEALDRLVKSAQKNTAQNIKLAKSQAQLEYYDLIGQLNDTLSATENLTDGNIDAANSLLSQIDSVRTAIAQYQLLEQQLLGTTNAFEQFKAAQEVDSQNTYGDSYVDMAQTMYDAFYKTGEVGTEANWAAIKALVPDEVYQGLTSDADKMKAIYEYFNKNILPTLTLDNDTLSLGQDNIKDFVERGISSGVFEGNTEEFDLVEGMNLERAAQLMGMTEAQAYAMFAALDKYNVSGGEQSFLGQLDDSTSGQIMEITTNMEELTRQKMALLEDGGYDAHKEEIDAINEKLAESEGELQDLGAQSYQTWQDYTKNDAALQALGAVSDKSQLLTEEMAQQLGIDFDENSGKTVQQVYDELLAKQLLLEKPTVLTAQLAIDNIDTQIEELQTALETGDYTNVDPVSVGLEVGDVPTKADIEAKLAALKEDKALIAATFDIELSEEDKAGIQEELNSIEEFTINDKTFKVVANGTSIVNVQLLAIKTLLGKLKDKTINIKTNYTSTGTPPSSGGGSSANGTAHVQGTAFKGGDWRAQATDKNSLVGELGPEILVRNGRWQTIGENGAEFTEVKKGDIIFNHKQSEQLLKNGYVTGRGKAFAEGTAYSGLWTPTGSSSSSSSSSNNNKKSSGGGSSKSSKDDKDVFDWFEVLLEEINEQLDLMNAKLENAVGISAKNSLLDQIINVNKSKLSTLKQGLDLYKNYANSLLEEIPSQYRKMAQDGAVAIEEFAGDADEKTLEAIENYREWAQKVADLTQQMEELNTEISTLAKQKIDNIAEGYENKKSLRDNKIDQYDAYNGLFETDVGFESANIYQAMINENNKNISILQKQRDAMQAELNKQVEAGNIKKYSQDWYDAVNDIAAVDTEIIELKTDTEDYQDSINELHWEKFELLMDILGAVSEEAENLIDILSNEDLVDKDTGEWTNEGITSLGLYAQQMEAAEVEAKKYEEEIKYLNKNWKKLGYTEQEYVEKLDELKSGQYDAIKAYHDSKDAIVDLNNERVDAIKDGIQKEIDAYEELINKKKEELDAEKDLYDFQKSISEKQKDIADIERKLAALSADNSASARAQRAKLQAELAEAQADLQDAYYERSISDQQEALDKELENFQDAKDKEMEGWDEYLENTEQVVADSLATIQSNTDVVYQTLKEMGQEYGLSITESLISPWEEGENAIQSFSEKFGISMSATVEELKELEVEFLETMMEIEQAGIKAVDTVQENAERYQQAEYQKPVGENPSGGDNGGNNSGGSGESFPYGKASETSGNIKEGAEGNAVKAIQYALNQLGYGNSGTKSVDGIFGSGTQSAVKAFQSAMGISADGIVGDNTRAKFKLKGYASGTTGIKKDQLALIDELGEELVINVQNGKLKYLSKGSGVIPADLTSNLMDWGELNPQNMLDQNRPVISAPHIVNNNFNVEFSVGEIVHVDTVTNDTLPNLTKTINKELDKYMKNLNAAVRKYTR